MLHCPLVVAYVGFVTDGHMALVVLVVPLAVATYRGRWLDYPRRLRRVARTTWVSIAPWKKRFCSSQISVAQTSLNWGSGPAGLVCRRRTG